MDKKDLESIATIVNSIVNSALEKSIGILREEIQERMDAFEQKIQDRMNESEQKMQERMDAFEQKMTDRMDAFEQKMLDKMFLFEHDYGEKINTIFDVSVVQKDKTYQIYQDNEKIKKQFYNHDLKLYQLDQRVFKLEHSSES